MNPAPALPSPALEPFLVRISRADDAAELIGFVHAVRTGRQLPFRGLAELGSLLTARLEP